MNNFDSDSSSLTVHGRTFPLTESHIHECLGTNAQSQGNNVQLNRAEGYSEQCTRLGVTKGAVQLKGLSDYLHSEKNRVVDVDFKRKFVVYSLGSFLCPTTKPAINQIFIHLVIDNVNWAKITLEFLQSGIWGQWANGRKQVFYLECVSPPTTFVMPRSTPSLAAWGDIKITNAWRQFEEIGGFKMWAQL
ncbi:hypothetical protein Vadar_025855 [Vaccinium darrowii]|uniref:Uncharacterized protein n=1 Tax=Vaccinium darrowii TaxID=229202 RepID=A0ACB7X3Y8_9ERIC|nr:hypothetical protein Vadar_025855 [Vaccinium darrowii]